MRLLLALAAALAATAAAECNPSMVNLTYLQWVSTNGCTAYVWRGADDRLWVEPTFCVPETRHWLSSLCPLFDPIGNYSYMNVPLMLTNQTLLEGVAAQFSRLKLKSVRYLSLADVKVESAEWPPDSAEPQFQPRDFVWSPSEDSGLLRLSCGGIACSVLDERIREGRWELLESLRAVPTLTSPCGGGGSAMSMPKLRPIEAQWAADKPLWSLARGINLLPACREDIVKHEVLDVAVGNASCRLHLHRRQSADGGDSAAVRLHAEPLLCYAGRARVMRDFNRRLSYISLTLLLHSDEALSAARAKLPALTARSVTFMRLLNPRPLVTIGWKPELRLASGGDSMLMRVPCAGEAECSELRSAVEADPLVIFSRVKWQPVAWVQEEKGAPGCRFAISEARLSVPLTLARAGPAAAAAACTGAGRYFCGAVRCQFARLADGRDFLVAQQRRSASVQFDRNWTHYVRGFGDEHNFWIGLKNIAALAGPSGSLLRIEAKLWNGTQLHAEYSSLRLIGMRYNLTYGQYLRHRSTTGMVDLLAGSRDAPFTAKDSPDPSVLWGTQYDHRGHYQYYPQLSQLGNAGWWWSKAATLSVDFNPNGIFHYGESLPEVTDRFSGLKSRPDRRPYVGLNLTQCDGQLKWSFLKEVRLMLEI